MAVDESALAAELAARHGVTTAQRLARLGIGKRAVDTLVRNQRLRRSGREVLVTPCWPDNLDHRMALACAATGGVVCFPTAGVAWELRKSPRISDVHVWVPHPRRVVGPDGVVVHYSRLLPETDVVRRRDGIAITSPPRTAFDAAAWLDPDDLESLIEHGLDRGYFIIPTLSAVLQSTGCRGRPGSVRFANVLRSRPAWRRPARSDYELRLERAMRRRGFPPLVREHRLVLLNGEVIHPDLGLPDDNFYVEVDHLEWHGQRHRSAYDRQRDLKARASGYAVERVTDLAIDHDLDATVEQLWIEWQRLVS
jgi:hypothetical protein